MADYGIKINKIGLFLYCAQKGKIVDGKLIMQETAKGKAVAAATVESAVDVRLDSKVAVFKLIPGFDPVLLGYLFGDAVHGDRICPRRDGTDGSQLDRNGTEHSV